MGGSFPGFPGPETIGGWLPATETSLPIVLADEKEVLQAAAATCWRLNGGDARLCIIRSTLHLDQILVSPVLAEELGDKGEILDSPQQLEFDDSGRLLTRCPE